MSDRPERYVKFRVVVAFWSLVGAGLGSLVIKNVAAGQGYAMPYLMIVLLLGVLVTPLLIVRRIEEQRIPTTILEDPATERTFPIADDAVREAVMRWDRRLDSRHEDTVRVQEIRKLLVDLVSDRLRLVHGIDPHRDPDRALALVGPHLRRMLTQPPSRMTTDEMNRLLAEMETL